MPPPCLCSLARPTAFLFLRFLPPFLEVTARTSTKMRILQQAAQKGSLVTQRAEPEDVSYLPFVNVAECSTLPLQARPSRSKALKRLAARIRRSCPFWRHALVPFLATGAAVADRRYGSACRQHVLKNASRQNGDERLLPKTRTLRGQHLGAVVGPEGGVKCARAFADRLLKTPRLATPKKSVPGGCLINQHPNTNPVPPSLVEKEVGRARDKTPMRPGRIKRARGRA